MKRSGFKRKSDIGIPISGRKRTPLPSPIPEHMRRGVMAEVTGDVRSVEKFHYVRSKGLLEACREIPCQHCGAEDGTVVAAHSNWGRGKAMGIKASDIYVASLCARCHSAVDSSYSMTGQERYWMWAHAHDKTVQELLARGLWPADCPLPEGHSRPK